MGLNWLQRLRGKQLAGSDSQTMTVAPQKIERILFIGFERIAGFHSFEWTDQKWRNAADYEVVFIDVGPLYLLLIEWSKQKQAEPDSFAVAPFNKLYENIQSLNKQLLNVINSERPVFALALPQLSFALTHHIYGAGIGTYSWCPLPVSVEIESGQVSKDVDVRFAGYRKYIKNWEFYFEDKPQVLDWFDQTDLARNQIYISFATTLFTNLSRHALGLELRYGSVDRDRPSQPLTLSGPIYLLHYPIGSDVRDAVRVLLRQFCDIDLSESPEPTWIESVKAPKSLENEVTLATIAKQLEVLNEQKVQAEQQKSKMEKWRRLLFEDGDALEEVVMDSLKLLGLENAEFGPKGDWDIVGELDEQLLLFEVKGLTKNAGRQEIHALTRHIDEYETKVPEKKVARGVLVVNAYRNEPPDTRDSKGKEVFANDAIKLAIPREFALLDTRTLYRVVLNVIEGRLPDKLGFLRTIRDTIGIVSIPEGN